jgi:hypothetical protein
MGVLDEIGELRDFMLYNESKILGINGDSRQDTKWFLGI